MNKCLDSCEPREAFALRVLPPGSHKIDLEPDVNLIDVYLGGSEGCFEATGLQDAPQKSLPNSFSFIPAGHARKLTLIRSGPSVLFLFSSSSTNVKPARQFLEDNPEAVFNEIDMAMLGIGVIVHESISSKGRVEDDFILGLCRELLTARLLQLGARSREATDISRPSNIQRALEYIASNLTSPLLLEDVAKHANSSPYHFSRQFRTVMGASLRRYVIMKRIEHAQHLISHSDLSLAEVAYSTGFSSQSHMTSAFRRFTGHTPGTFRGKMLPKMTDIGTR